MADHTDPQNQSKVQQWVDERIKSGKFKDCIHLKVIQRAMAVGVGSAVVCFLPQCDQRSFEWPRPRVDDQSQMDMLTRSMVQGGEIISCPANCFCFISRADAELAERKAQTAAARREKWERRRARFAGPMKNLFGWFGKLPWQTQLLIILLGILAISPKWVPQLIVLIKALAQLFH